LLLHIAQKHHQDGTIATSILLAFGLPNIQRPKFQAYVQVLINNPSTLASVISETIVANRTVKANTTPDDWSRVVFAM